MTANRNTRCKLWAGLLIISSLAPLVVVAGENTIELQISVAEGLVSLTARDVPLQDVVREIALQNDLQLVQHLALDRLVSIEIDRQPLPDVLDEILADESYQLYRMVENADDADAAERIPGSLWIFSEGSALAPAAMLYFEAVLLEGNVGEKKEAIRELRRLGTPDAVQTLSVALGDDDPRVRNAAMDALSLIGGDDSLAAIASASMHEDPLVRGKAADAIAMADGYSSTEYLKIVMQDEDPRVRASVIDSLGDIGDERSLQVIQQALQDPDPTVRERALEVINEINDDAAFRALFPPE